MLYGNSERSGVLYGYHIYIVGLTTYRGSNTSLFDDIVEVDLELTSQEHSNLQILLCAFGCESSQTGDVTRYCSNGFVLNVYQTSTPTYRIRKAICSLTENSEVKKEFRFGDSVTLSMNKDSAHWQFGSGNTSHG